ncbi:MAG TPA: hypothetical protein VFL13_03740 [Candidatus Baltobacteraceae bacterium]|nr:hypothetical protein [Candidatus Baltobacteraceae bacterium]
MKSSTATAAIVGERLRRERAAIFMTALLCAAAAFLQRFDEPFGQLAGALIFGTFAACGAAMLLRSRRQRDLAMYEIAAPVYGRELARAHALFACAITSAGLIAYWIVLAAYGSFNAVSAATTLACGFATALSCMNARRAGMPVRVLITALIIALCVMTFALTARWPLVLAVCAAAAFVALRQYGEVLARA